MSAFEIGQLKFLLRKQSEKNRRNELIINILIRYNVPYVRDLVTYIRKMPNDILQQYASYGFIASDVYNAFIIDQKMWISQDSDLTFEEYLENKKIAHENNNRNLGSNLQGSKVPG